MSNRRVILLVDDDDDLRESVAAALEAGVGANDVAVMQARDGRAGLVLARSRKPALVVVDLDMPVMNGVEFIEHLRDDPALKDVPVILASGHGRIGSIARDLTVNAYLPKPFHLEGLLNAIERFCTVIEQ